MNLYKSFLLLLILAFCRSKTISVKNLVGQFWNIYFKNMAFFRQFLDNIKHFLNLFIHYFNLYKVYQMKEMEKKESSIKLILKR